MKKHLRILYGCDDRFELVTNTVKVCRPYFDSVRVLNAGPHEFRERLQQALGDVEVTQFNQFFEIESCRRAQIKDVPWDDWVMWLDADETPSPKLLPDLDKIIEHCETNNYDLVRFYWSEHTEGVPHPPSNIAPSNNEFHTGKYSMFCPNRFIKRKKGIKLASAFGAHELFQNANERWTYLPYAVHHHKSHIQYFQSVTFSGFMNPSVHYDCNKPLSDIVNSPEYIALREFQKRTGVYTSNDLVRKLKIEKDMEFKSQLKELFLSFPGRRSAGLVHGDMLITFKFMHELASRYDLDVNSPYYPCGRECCKYGEVQL